MKYKATIKIVVDTEDYSDVKSVEDVKELVHDMIISLADWPDDVDIAVTS